MKRWANQAESRFTDAGQAAIVELYNITSGFQEILKLSCFADNTATGDKAEQSIQDYAIVFKGVENSLEAWNAEWIRELASAFIGYLRLTITSYFQLIQLLNCLRDMHNGLQP